MDKIEYRKSDKDNTESKINTLKTILKFFQHKGGNPSVHLKIRTKMGSPKLNFSSIKNTLAKKVTLSTVDIIGGILNKVNAGVSKGTKNVTDLTVGTVVNTVKGVVDTVMSPLNIKSDSKFTDQAGPKDDSAGH